jgi:hypothetical protein
MAAPSRRPATGKTEEGGDMAAHKEHVAHDHHHGKDCGHLVVRHGDHY